MFGKKILMHILFVLAVQLGAHESENPKVADPFALFTIPKSGSHLLIKTLYFMTEFTPLWHMTPPTTEETFDKKHFPYTHCCLPKDLIDYYAHSSTKQILGIRDLRDVCVSIVFQIQKGIWPEFSNQPKKTKAFNKMSFDEQLLFVINQEYAVNPPQIKHQLAIKKVAEQVISLMKNPEILICRYEDIVGERGGGSLEMQKKTLQKIAQHIGVKLSTSQIDELVIRLYGDEENPFGQGDFQNYQTTFRSGKIGSWKTAFKPIHKTAFKKRLGAQLIDLGYEKDLHW